LKLKEYIKILYLLPLIMGAGKPRGIRAGRKLANRRRSQR